MSIIRINKLLSLLALIFILDFNFFGLFKFPKFFQLLNSIDHKSLIIFLGCLFCVINRKELCNKEYGWIKKYFIIICISVFLFIINTYIRYSEQGFYYSFRMVEHLLIVVISPIILLYCKKKGIIFFIRFVCRICLIYLIIQIINEIYFLEYGGLLFEGTYRFDPSIIREGRARLNIGAVSIMMIPLSLEMLFNKFDKKNNRLYFFYFVLGIFALFYIQMSRYYMIVVGLCIFFLLLYYWRKRFVLVSLIFTICGIAIIHLNLIGSLFYTLFDVNQKYYISTSARLGAISYFWNLFESNPLLGFGFLLSDSPDYYYIMHGPLGIYFTVDIGILGFISQSGLIGGILIVLFFSRLISTCHISRHSQYFSIIFTITFFVTACSLTVFCMDSPMRIILLPITLGISEYLRFAMLNRSI